MKFLFLLIVLFLFIGCTQQEVQETVEEIETPVIVEDTPAIEPQQVAPVGEELPQTAVPETPELDDVFTEDEVDLGEMI